MLKSVIFKIICVFVIFFTAFISAEISEKNEGTEDGVTEENSITEEAINSAPNTIKHDLFWTPSESVDTTEFPNSETNDILIKNETIIEPIKEALESAELPVEDSNPEIQNTTAFFENESEQHDYAVKETSSSQTGFNKHDHSYQEMNEKIVLTRNNCNLEIPVDDTHDLKIQIKFESVQNNGHGKCCIALSGHKNAKLAVLISQIHLQNDVNSGYEETLKVVLTNSGVDFVLKQYYENQVHQSVLLTESHSVFIFLNYNVTNVKSKPSNDYSQFNLEAFRYGESENFLTNENHYKSPSYSLPKLSAFADIDKIYITTDKPTFQKNYVLKN